MIWILSSILYVLLGYVYSEAVWNDPEVKEEIENIQAIAPDLERVNAQLALVRLIVAVFWPIFCIGSFIQNGWERIQARYGTTEDKGVE